MVVVDAVGVVAAVVEVRVAAGQGGGGVRAGQVGAGLGEAVLGPGLEVRRVGGQLVARGGDGGQAGEGCLAELKGGISLRL